MSQTKYNLRQMKILAWTNYSVNSPFSEEANFWYDMYHLFVEEYLFVK